MAEKYGDDRRSPIVERAESKAFSEEELLSSDPVTVVMSAKGWIRSAKGHDIDPEALSYKSGDSFRLAAKGKSNQPVVILDNTGRAYTLATHTLPSARGQGEPITGRINAPSGAAFEGLFMGQENQKLLLSSDAGYGFIAKLSDLQTKNKAGKAVLNLPKGAKVIQPFSVEDAEESYVVAASNEGRMLVFPLKDLPELARGKGNKMIGIPSARVAAREEFVVGVAVMKPGQVLKVNSGKRYLNMKFAELEHYIGDRGRRGHKLPRGFQKVDGLEIVE